MERKGFGAHCPGKRKDRHLGRTPKGAGLFMLFYVSPKYSSRQTWDSMISRAA